MASQAVTGTITGLSNLHTYTLATGTVAVVCWRSFNGEGSVKEVNEGCVPYGPDCPLVADQASAAGTFGHRLTCGYKNARGVCRLQR